MNRREFLTSTAAAALTAPLSLSAASSKRLNRPGFLGGEGKLSVTIEEELRVQRWLLKASATE